MLRPLENYEIKCYQSWLQKRVSIEKVQARKFGAPAPDDELWQRFWGQMEAGDELWDYSTPREDWQNLGGECGFAIVREGAVFDFWVSFCN